MLCPFQTEYKPAEEITWQRMDEFAIGLAYDSPYGRIRRRTKPRSPPPAGVDLQTVLGPAAAHFQRRAGTAAFPGGMGRRDLRVDEAAAGYRPHQPRGGDAHWRSSPVLHHYLHV